MQLDMRTLFIVMVLAYTVFGLLQLVMWRLRRSELALALWSFSNLACAAGSLLIALRGTVPEAISIAGGNALLLLGYVLMWAGLRHFARQRFRWFWVWLAPLLLGALYLGVPAIGNNLALRICLFSCVIALFCAVTLRDAAAAQREEPLFMRSVAMMTFAFTFAFSGARAALAMIDPLDVAGFLDPNSVQVTMTLLTLLIVLMWNLSVLLMISERLEHQLRDRAHHDPLTGVLNRIGLREFALPRLQQLRREGSRASVLLMDLDRFKHINDRYGHDAGDRLLQAFAQVTRSILHADDLFSRHGGEEFCLLLPYSSPQDARRVAERIRIEFERQSIDSGGESVSTTVSIGVTEVHLAHETLEHAISRADHALYEAKARGRNRVQLSPAPAPVAKPASA